MASPTVALIGGLLLVTILAGLVAVDVSGIALDETLIQQSAVHYTSNLPHSLLHDLDARATDRLYSLVLSVAFRFGDGVAAIQFDHVLSVLLFVSAGVPVYLLSRRLLRSPWSAVAVALLSVTLPWLALTTALFTENLSYPLFWWTMLAICHAVARPSPRHDAFTLFGIGLLVVTRIQFAAVFVGYVGALAFVGLVRVRAMHGRRPADLLRAAARRYPFSLAITAIGLVAAVYLRTSSWGTVERFLGSYVNVVSQHGLPPNMGVGLLVEVIALALGVGILPAIVSVTWYVKRLSRPQLDESYLQLAAVGVVLVVFLVLTVYSQFGYLGPATEERYFFYVVPVFWLGTFAALREGGVRPGDLVLCALALACVYASITFLSPLTEETAFLAPAESVGQHVIAAWSADLGIGMTVQDVLAVFSLFAGVFLALLWRRPAWRLAGTLGVAAAVQLLMTGYAYAVITGNVPGIPGRTGGNLAALGWVDAHARSTRVAWLDNLSTGTTPGATDAQTRIALFWNKRLTSWIAIPELGLPIPIWPMAALPGSNLASVDPHSGILVPQNAVQLAPEVVQNVDSPFLQLAGPELARSPDGQLQLTALEQPIRATWLALGLNPDASVPMQKPVRIYIFASDPTAATSVHLTLGFASPPATPAAHSSTVQVQLGRVRQQVTLPVGSTAPRVLTLTVCLPPGQPASGTLSARPSTAGPAPAIGGWLERAVVSESSVGSCGSTP